MKLAGKVAVVAEGVTGEQIIVDAGFTLK